MKQEAVDIKPGSEIVSGPQKEGNIVLHDVDSKSLYLCLCEAEQAECFCMSNSNVIVSAKVVSFNNEQCRKSMCSVLL